MSRSEILALARNYFDANTGSLFLPDCTSWEGAIPCTREKSALALVDFCQIQFLQPQPTARRYPPNMRHQANFRPEKIPCLALASAG